MKKTLFLLVVACLIAGCSTNDKNETLRPKGDQIPELTRLSTMKPIKQDKANEAKDLLSSYDNIKEIHAVNDDKQLIISIAIDHGDRFNLKKEEKKLEKIATKHFNDYIVTLSTDKKLEIELKQLETDIQANKVAKKELTNKINVLKKLLKEAT